MGLDWPTVVGWVVALVGSGFILHWVHRWADNHRESFLGKLFRARDPPPQNPTPPPTPTPTPPPPPSPPPPPPLLSPVQVQRLLQDVADVRRGQDNLVLAIASLQAAVEAASRASQQATAAYQASLQAALEAMTDELRQGRLEPQQRWRFLGLL